MGHGSARYVSYTALVLLSAATTTAALPDLWAVNIHEGPAPSPKDGPPFSAHASRDRALLPYQIIGIVGGYVGSVVIIGTLLVTVGRTLRRRAHELAARPTEMVKPMNREFDPSPISPVSSRAWYAPRMLRTKKSATSSIRSMGTAMPPEVRSVASFDSNVIEADRQQRQDEMERLYAAVMRQDERQSPQIAPQQIPEIPQGAPPEYSRRVPPRLITDAPALRHLQMGEPYSNAQNQMTPKSPVRAIYPPDSSMPVMPSSPTSPIRAEYPSSYLSPGYMQHHKSQSSELHPGYHAPTPSNGSTRSGSTLSKERTKKSLRKLKISAPIQPLDDNSDGARTPLSPRCYVDAGIPPELPTSRTVDSQYQPTTPATATSWGYGDDYDNDHEPRQRMDRVRDLPRPHPNRIASYEQTQSPRRTQPVASVNNPLPFRQMQAEKQQQQRGQNVQMPSSQYLHPMSAGPVKTTFLETGRRGPHLGTPRTGMATPYSPYMPYTPLTPVTPRLMSRAERKQKMKDDRALRGALTEEQAVKEEGEVWGSGY
ncbi:Hypothetical protein R9X50_00052000 [Acrodontium crateriforme]|uniref:Uncharacterized protein n=1 Tax=Acrodontium crateriforme TaxID=150365 RepID=A0AAQ3LYY0_9PEZI|nr:Hypothetical protein R9X50_00052000 [Acrodontium crateriforme]